MSVLAPALPSSCDGSTSFSPRDPSPVLAVVDLEAPFEPVLRRAAAAAAMLEAPLRVIVLHPRPGFTTDPAIAARIATDLSDGYGRAVSTATEASRDHGLDDVAVCRVPYARLPIFGGAVRRARRAASTHHRRAGARLVVAAAHLHGADEGRNR